VFINKITVTSPEYIYIPSDPAIVPMFVGHNFWCMLKVAVNWNCGIVGISVYRLTLALNEGGSVCCVSY
jgi:hypothetical protein